MRKIQILAYGIVIKNRFLCVAVAKRKCFATGGSIPNELMVVTIIAQNDEKMGKFFKTVPLKEENNDPLAQEYKRP